LGCLRIETYLLYHPSQPPLKGRSLQIAEIAKVLENKGLPAPLSLRERGWG